MIIERLNKAYDLYKSGDKDACEENLELLLNDLKNLDAREECLMVEMILNRLQDRELTWFEYHIEDYLKDLRGET